MNCPAPPVWDHITDGENAKHIGQFDALRDATLAMHIALVDEAHLILASRLPAFGNQVRMSRSKGGVVVLVSQSPNDFEGEDDDF